MLNYWENKFRGNSAEFGNDFGGYMIAGADDETVGHIDTATQPHLDLTFTKSKPVNNPPSELGILDILETAAETPFVQAQQVLDKVQQTANNPPGVGGSLLPAHFWWYVFGAAALGFWLLPKALSAGGAAAMKYGKYALL